MSVSLLTFLKPSGYLTHHQVNIKKFYMVLKLHLNVLYSLLPGTALTDRFSVTELESVFCAVRTESLYKTDAFRL